MLLSPAATQSLTATEIQAIEVFYSAWKLHQPELLNQVCTPD